MKNKSLLEILNILSESLGHVEPHGDMAEDVYFHDFCCTIVTYLELYAKGKADILIIKKKVKECHNRLTSKDFSQYDND